MTASIGWRRWLASNGGLGSSTQRALTWNSLCVLSGEGGTHSLQDVKWLLSLCLVVDSLLRLLLDTLGQLLVSLFTDLPVFVMIVCIMTVILTAELWCL